MSHSYLYFIFIVVVIGFGCASVSNQTNNSTGKGDAYSSSYPSQDISAELIDIEQSIKRYTTTARYRTYRFEDANLTIEQIREQNISTIASDEFTISESKAGTAITLFNNDQHAVFITAQHVLSFPDTLLSYKPESNAAKQKIVESLSIKNKQRSHLYADENVVELDLIAENASKDLALIKVNKDDRNFSPRPLSINFGNARDLKLGSFVYVFGYPLGAPMVTRGIVSAPNYDQRSSFLTDALFNHGISGGLIVASRNNFESFEWVGMAVSATATQQQFLIPAPSKQKKYRNFQAYTDTAVVSEQRTINYGVTQATPIEEIIRFLLTSENELNDLGMSVTGLRRSDEASSGAASKKIIYQ